MNRHALGVIALAMATGCRPMDFDDVDAVDLGVPGSAVFGYSDIGEAMFVFSDIPDVCDMLSSAEPPLYSDWWVVSAWTRSAVRVDEQLPASGYAVVSVYNQVNEHESEDAWLQLSTMDPDYARGKLFLELDNGDRIKARFDAEPCDADLFVGFD